MANSTWRAATNNVLALSSLPEIESDADFNNGGGSLQKFQSVAKQFVKLGHHHLGVRARNHFNTERFEFDTSTLTAIYEIQTGLSPENIKLESFYTVSTGDKANFNQPLREMSYDRFQKLYPDISKIPTGAPEYVVLLPLEGDDEDPPHRLRVVPDPDDVYKIEYQCVLHAGQLTTATSKILFPPHYEHALWEFCWELLEIDLGEGKEAKIGFLAREAANAVFLAAGRTMNSRKGPRSMRIPSIGRGRSGYYRSPLSVDQDGNLTGL